MNQNPIPNEPNDVLKKRRGRPPKSDLLKNGCSTTQRTVVPIAPYPTPGNMNRRVKIMDMGKFFCNCCQY